MSSFSKPMRKTIQTYQTDYIPSGSQIIQNKYLSHQSLLLQSNNKLIDSNSKYFAFSNSISVNLIETTHFLLEKIISPSDEQVISSIRLSNSRLISICQVNVIRIYTINDNQILEFVESDKEKINKQSISQTDSGLIRSLKVNSPIIQMEFTKNENVLLFTTLNKSFHIYDLTTDKTTMLSISVSMFYILNYNEERKEIITFHEKIFSIYDLKTKSSLSTMSFAKEKEFIENENIEITHIVDYNLINIQENSKKNKIFLFSTSKGDIFIVSFYEKSIINKITLPKEGYILNIITYKSKEFGSAYVIIKNSMSILKLNISSKEVIFKKVISRFSIINSTSNDNQFAVSLENGSCIIYDIHSFDVIKSFEASHSETIFDIKSCEADGIKYILTCSYDETIKVWDSTEMRLIKTIKLGVNMYSNYQSIKQRIIDNKSDVKVMCISSKSEYNKISSNCICISPLFESDKIVLTGNSNGYIKVINLQKGRIIEEYSLLKILDSNQKSYIVSNKNDLIIINLQLSSFSDTFFDSFRKENKKQDSLLSTSLFHYLFLFKFTSSHENDIVDTQLKSKTKTSSHLEVIKVITFSQTCFVSHFSNFHLNEIVIPFLDGSVKVYDIVKSIDLFNFNVHSKKAFMTVYSPILDNVFASSSDDCLVTIYVLNREENKSHFEILKGHLSRTRKIVFHPKISSILLSSSWDGTIKVWDISKYTCIKTMNYHFSDVYGIEFDIRVDRVVYSCGRDNCIRKYNILFDYEMCLNELFEICKNANEIIKNMNSDANETYDIYNKIDEFIKNNYNDIFILNLVDLLKVGLQIKKSTQNFFHITHISDLYSKYDGLAKENERKYENENTRREFLVNSIDFYLKTCNWEKCIDLLIRNKEYDKAVLISPFCGIERWKEVKEIVMNVFMNVKDKNEDKVKDSKECIFEKENEELKFGCNITYKSDLFLLINISKSNFQTIINKTIKNKSFELALFLWSTRRRGEEIRENIDKSKVFSDLYSNSYGIDNILLEIERSIKNDEKASLKLACFYMSSNDFYKSILTIIQSNMIHVACVLIIIFEFNKGFSYMNRKANIEKNEIKIKNLDSERFYHIVSHVFRYIIDYEILMLSSYSLTLKLLSSLSSLSSSSVYYLELTVLLLFYACNHVNIKENLIIPYLKKAIGMNREAILTKIHNIYISHLIKLEYNILFDIFMNEYSKVSSNIQYKTSQSKTKTYISDSFEDLIIIIRSISYMEFNKNDKSKLKIRLLLSSSLLEVRNNNENSVFFYMSEANRMAESFKYDFDCSDLVIISRIISFLYNKPRIMSTYIEFDYIKKRFGSDDYNKAANQAFDYEFSNSFYTCSNDFSTFFRLSNEEQSSKGCNFTSNFSKKNLKGDYIKISNEYNKEVYYLSLSEYLEWIKYISFLPFLNDENGKIEYI